MFVNYILKQGICCSFTEKRMLRNNSPKTLAVVITELLAQLSDIVWTTKKLVNVS